MSDNFIQLPSYPQLALASAYSTGLNSAQTILTYTPPSDGTFTVRTNLTITAVATDVMKLQVVYTDETTTVRTQQIFTTSGAGVASATGAFVFSDFSIRVLGGTTITISTVLTVGSGSITYDVGAEIL